MQIRDRIKEFKRVPAKDILPNPKNWRVHSDAQVDALRGVLAEVGWANAVLVMETPDGLQLIDGHLRTEVAPDSMIPVLVLDVTEAEADKILATHDPLGAMAEANSDKLEELLSDMTTDCAAMGLATTDLSCAVALQVPSRLVASAAIKILKTVVFIGSYLLLAGNDARRDRPLASGPRPVVTWGPLGSCRCCRVVRQTRSCVARAKPVNCHPGHVSGHYNSSDRSRA